MSRRRTNWLKIIGSVMMVAGVVIGMGGAAMQTEEGASMVAGVLLILGFFVFVVSRFHDADSKMD